MTAAPHPESPDRGTTGDHTQRGVPVGVTSLTPYIGVPDPAGASDFYADVFGARVVETTRSEGVVIQVHLDFGNGHLHLERPNPESGLSEPASDRAACYALGYYCEDVDALLARARSAGATVLTPPVNFASGDRFAGVRDPYGVQWSIMSRIEDLSETESARRIAAWANQGSQDSDPDDR